LPARVESALDDAATRTDPVGRPFAGPRGYTSVEQRHRGALDARMAAGGRDGPADMAGRGAQRWNRASGRRPVPRDRSPVARWGGLRPPLPHVPAVRRGDLL